MSSHYAALRFLLAACRQAFEQKIALRIPLKRFSHSGQACQVRRLSAASAAPGLCADIISNHVLSVLGVYVLKYPINHLFAAAFPFRECLKKDASISHAAAEEAPISGQVIRHDGAWHTDPMGVASLAHRLRPPRAPRVKVDFHADELFHIDDIDDIDDYWPSKTFLSQTVPVTSFKVDHHISPVRPFFPWFHKASLREAFDNECATVSRIAYG